MLKGTKIAWLSDSPTTVTGFATISKNILQGLSEQGAECHAFAHNLYSQPIKPGIEFEDGTKLNFHVHGCGREGYYKDLIMPKLQKIRPQVFGVLLDTFMVYPWFANELDFAPARSIFYFPSDGGGGLPNGCEIILRKVDVPVAMSKFAQRQVKEIHGIDSEYIPHAIDQKIYYPKNKDECKAKFGLQGRFVVGTVARNQGRKMMDRTIKAFALFAKDRPDAVLFMHTDPFDAAAVFNLQLLIQRYSLENRVYFSGMRFFEGFDYKDMVDVYGAMDVFFLSTSGEGFGVPIIEAMACEIPCVVTDYTTTYELIKEEIECGYPVKLSGTEQVDWTTPLASTDNELMNGTITGSWTVERGIMDVKDAAEKLALLYNNPGTRIRFGRNGRDKVLKYYTWDVVIPQWVKIVERLSK